MIIIIHRFNRDRKFGLSNVQGYCIIYAAYMDLILLLVMPKSIARNLYGNLLVELFFFPWKNI